MKTFVPVAPPKMAKKQPIDWIVEVNIPPEESAIALCFIDCHGFIVAQKRI